MSADPTADAHDLFDRGHAALAAGDCREALECFNRAITLRPDVAAGYRARARALVGLDRRGEALADLDRAVRLKPDDPAAYAERAELLFRQKSYDAAAADCDRVLALDAGWAAVRGLRAQCYAAAGLTDKALEDFAAAIAADPGNAAGYLLARANLHLDCEHFAEVVADCTAVLKLDPDNPAAYRTRGLARRELGDLPAADADLSEAVRLDPAAVLARLARASVRSAIGHFAEAAADCDEVIRRSPGSAQAYTLRGLCRERLDDPVGALADLTEAVRLAPSAAGYNLRAAAHYRAGRYADAARDHQEALKRSPRDPAAFNQLAWLWATAPDPAARNGTRAKECAIRACELTEWQDPTYLDTLAAACAECGEFADAARWQEKAIELTTAPELTAEYAERLELYKRGQPYRTPSTQPA
jgi:tetratricopeptide (TPR) repeat protein